MTFTIVVVCQLEVSLIMSYKLQMGDFKIYFMEYIPITKLDINKIK